MTHPPGAWQQERCGQPVVETAPQAVVDPQDIRHHYDMLSSFYWALWGEHLHHGFWEGDESPAEAQLKLVEHLAARSAIGPMATVLDVGCGIGGSALWLASRGCRVRGINISPMQVLLAGRRARRAGLADRATFEVMDAGQMELPAGGFDAVWVIECTEHLEDKRQFLERAFELLRPGGVLAMCTWLAGDSNDAAAHRARAVICEAMLCPSLHGARDYLGWMHCTGFRPVVYENLTRQVERTWEYCAGLVRRPVVERLLRVHGGAFARFAGSFSTMRKAYADGALAYGLFAAWKP